MYARLLTTYLHTYWIWLLLKVHVNVIIVTSLIVSSAYKQGPSLTLCQMLDDTSSNSRKVSW